jgi:hypothetical protein
MANFGYKAYVFYSFTTIIFTSQSITLCVKNLFLTNDCPNIHLDIRPYYNVQSSIRLAYQVPVIEFGKIPNYTKPYFISSLVTLSASLPQLIVCLGITWRGVDLLTGGSTGLRLWGKRATIGNHEII